jgi:long-subunit acyl-CoA synthetase (AMP-forming)
MTREKIDRDGWLHLDDIGVLQNNGSIKIIERINELAKLQNG